ncbi:MAG: hypothetical protein RJA99_2712 [Pseudomonadota bacterium]
MLRNGNGVALSVLIDYPDALHRTLVPDRPFAEVALAASTLPAAELAALQPRGALGGGGGQAAGLGHAAVLSGGGWCRHAHRARQCHPETTHG